MDSGHLDGGFAREPWYVVAGSPSPTPKDDDVELVRNRV